MVLLGWNIKIVTAFKIPTCNKFNTDVFFCRLIIEYYRLETKYIP